MASYIGNKEIVSMYLGNRDIDSFSIGEQEIYTPDEPIPPVETTSARYFKFDGNKVIGYNGTFSHVTIPRSYSIEPLETIISRPGTLCEFMGLPSGSTYFDNVNNIVLTDGNTLQTYIDKSSFDNYRSDFPSS